MRKFGLLVFVFSLFFVSNVFASDAKNAQKFVEDVVAEGIEGIINSSDAQEVRVERFRKLFNSALDVDYIGKFVLGRNWRTATAEQRQAFLDAYRELNIQTWSGRFEGFNGKGFVYQNVVDSSTNDQYFVNTTIDIGEGQKPAKVVWRVRYANNEYKIVDIVIENVSLAITARNEYSAYIKTSSLDALIKDLQSKI